jgi:hypothetical protein
MDNSFLSPSRRKGRRKGKQKILESFSDKIARMQAELGCDHWLKIFKGDNKNAAQVTKQMLPI